MAPKTKTVFVCQQCGQSYSKWSGRCQDCGQWNSIVEERERTIPESSKSLAPEGLSRPQLIGNIGTESIPRLASGLSELDSILGGGLVPGSVVLIGGEPGVGKSTLLLQAAEFYANHSGTVLYVSGEESASQIALRSSRLDVRSEALYVVAENRLEAIQDHVEKFAPSCLIVDSIQTVFSGAVESQMGSVGQLRECAHTLISMAKSKNIATFLVGHVTKEGTIAGPKIIEHMVDVVLYFEGTSSLSFRLLRSIKNRFGSTNEVGVFEILSKGLRAVANPSELFLAERPTRIPGSVVAASLEGSRPILVEVQALVSSTSLAMPRRTSIGIDPNRVSLLVAILEKRGGFRLYDQDVYVNIAGGLKLNEPAVDLAISAAIISSYTGKMPEAKTVFLGEVGLGGEIRSVPRAAERLKEARRIGLTCAYLPMKAAKELKEYSEMNLIGVENIQQLGDLS